MSARSGLLGGLRLRNVRPASKSVVAQRRLLNHFTARVPNLDVHEEFDRLKQNGCSQPFTLAVKDNIATTTPRVPTTCASPFLLNYSSPLEATIVTQLRARGAVIVGKTNLDEFGMGSHSTNSALGPVAQDSRGISKNKGASDGGGLFSAGGSSGGSAIAVADGEATVALGTDTGGSVRLPAAYTGVVGFKPSYGMLSRYGVVPYANSLDTVGLLSRSVEEIAKLVVGDSNVGGLWAEHDPKDPTSLSAAARKRCGASREGYRDASIAISDQAANEAKNSPDKVLDGIKFGIPLEYNIEELDPRIRNAWADTASLLQKLGARIVPVSLPSTRHALSAYYVIAPAEASSNLAKYDGVRYGTNAKDKGSNNTKTNPNDKDAVLYSAVRGAGFGPEVKRRILLGSYTLSSEAMDNYFVQAQKVRRLVRRDFDRAFSLSNTLLGGSATDRDGAREEENDDDTTFDLSDLSESIPMENKFGPTQVDFLLCPTAPTLAPLLEDVINEGGEGDGNKVVDAYMNDVFTVPASLAGLPAVSIPVTVTVGTTETSLGSAGLQLIGQYWDDARLLKVASAVAKCLGRSD